MTDNHIPDLDKMLAAAGIALKASFTRAEVCKILGISTRTFWTMVCLFEPGDGVCHRHPATLDSFMLRGHRRVPYHEIADFLSRNRTYDRLHKASATQLSIPFPD